MIKIFIPKRETINQYDRHTGVSYMLALGNSHIHARISYKDNDSKIYTLELTPELKKLYFKCKDTKDIISIKSLANYIRLKNN